MLVLHVGVQFLQSLQALGQVFIVDFGIKHHHVLHAQALGAVDVKANALFQQVHHSLTAELLLGDLLSDAACSVPEKVVPLSPFSILSAIGYLHQQVIHRHGQDRQGAQLMGQWLILIS